MNMFSAAFDADLLSAKALKEKEMLIGLIWVFCDLRSSFSGIRWDVVEIRGGELSHHFSEPVWNDRHSTEWTARSSSRRSA